MKLRLLALASWIGLLIPTLSEYGFREDFPLMPPLWLVIAVSALLFAAAHSAIDGRIQSISKRESSTYLAGNLPTLLSQAATGHTSPRITNRSRRSSQDKCNAAGSYREQMDSSGVIVTARDPVSAIIFLGPTATRGPPKRDDQIDRKLCRPARHLDVLPPPSEIGIRDSLTARNTTPVPTYERMI